MTALRLTLVSILFAALSCGTRAASDVIAVSATAAPAYTRSLDADGRSRPETYVFTPGIFMGGGTADSGMKRTSFLDLVTKLAPSLARQNYLPTKDVTAADLVIVVHWGASLVYQDALKDVMLDRLKDALPALQAEIADKGYGDSGPINDIADSLQLAADNARNDLARNAYLLGYTRDLIKLGQHAIETEEEKTLRAELGEERYFVVLQAYDNRLFRQEKKARLLWVTRLSVRSPGNNFTGSLLALGDAGAKVYGRELDGLVHVPANLRDGKVEVGALKSLGVAEEKKKP